MRILVVNGPNLDRLGVREPEIYGTQTLGDIERRLRERAAALGAEVDFFQSASEGRIIEYLHREGPAAHGIVINPAALTHYSIALYDCLKTLAAPVVEVHISNLHARTDGSFRTRSVTAPAAVGVITGLGLAGYLLALEYLIDRDQ